MFQQLSCSTFIGEGHGWYVYVKDKLTDHIATQREKDRERERDTKIERGRERDRKIERGRERDRKIERGRERDRKTERGISTVSSEYTGAVGWSDI